MTAFLTTVSIILQLVPALIAAIKAIEEAIPGKGQGEQKLAAIRQIIEVASDSASEMWPMIEKTIGVRSTGLAWRCKARTRPIARPLF
jgi:hypothetical protein